MSTTYVIPKGVNHPARIATLDMIAKRLSGLPANRAWAVELKEHRQSNTDAQRAYLWGVVYRTIADFCGCSTEDVHRDLKRMFLREGESHGIVRTRSTTKLDVAETADYIDQVIAWAATELGVVVPAPVHLPARAA